MRRLVFFLPLLLVSVASPLVAQVAPAFAESEQTVATGIGQLAGTLTLPTVVKGKVPVVLIIPGSGPTDRNCNQLPALNTNAFRLLAEGLASRGIASLRYDKRGVGGSKAALQAEADLRFDGNVADARAWFTQLKANPQFSKVVILGHSEGSLVGMLLAQRTAAAGYVSVAGAALAADGLIMEQMQSQPDAVRSEVGQIFEQLRRGETVKDFSPYLNALFRPSVQPYLRSWIQYRPTDEIRKLTVPTLIIQGTTDLQTPEKEGRALAEAQPKAQLLVVAGMSHVLKVAPADRATNLATYNQPDLPLAPELLPALVAFIQKL